MRRHFVYQIFIVSTLLANLENQVILDFKLFDFINTEGLTKFNKPCELRRIDKCDPVFEICLSSDSAKKCDILKNKTNVFTDKNYISEVLKAQIPLQKLPKQLIIDVIVEDNEDVGPHERINEFNMTFRPLMYELKVGFLRPSVYKANLRLQYKFIFQCQIGFFGERCENLCENNSTEKLCLLGNCRIHCLNGICKIKNTQSMASCYCSKGWQGINCSEKVKFCESGFCNSTQLMCHNDRCYCSSHVKGEKLYCLNEPSLSKRSISHKFQDHDSGYTLTVAIIIIALMALIVFVSVTFYKCRSRKLQVSDPVLASEENEEDLFSSSPKLMFSETPLDEDDKSTEDHMSTTVQEECD